MLTVSKKQSKSYSRRISSTDTQSSAQVLDINERFIYACETGDLVTVKYILDNVKEFNIEITDNLGRTALRLAVENEHLEIVQALLAKSDSRKIRDALLLAIFMGYTSIAEAILKHPKYKVLNEKKILNGDTDSFWQTPSSDDAQFSPDITPIMLASQYNRTELVQILLINGDRIAKPHEFSCKCTECLNKFKFDSLRHAQSRLNAYKGLASESYISLASIDPILTAFELSHELGILANREKYFKHEYLQLRNSLSTYSVKLLNNVRGRDELDIVLNKVGKEKEEKYELLGRLDLALKYKEIPFVAHSNCQQKLEEIWYTGVRKISKMNPLIILLLILLHVILLPLSSIFYIILPKSKIGKFMRQPAIKFINHFTSYMIFVCLVIASYFVREADPIDFKTSHPSFYPLYKKYINKNLTYQASFTNFYIRPTAPMSLDIAITIFVIGQTWFEIRKLFTLGVHDYLAVSNNTFSFSMNVFYLLAYGLKYYTMILVSSILTDMNSNYPVYQGLKFWDLVDSLKENDPSAQANASQIYAYQCFYWLNSDRFYWEDFDPIFVSEAAMAFANLLTFLRLSIYLGFNQQVGPLQITLGKMINDILKFLCIFVIVFASFVFGLNNLYWYYDPSVRSSVETNRSFASVETRAQEAFGTLGKTAMTLFFALYTIGDSTDPLIDGYSNLLTVPLGYLLFALFHVFNITIMINMLIAMMTKSYEDTIHHSDIEWKFTKSKLYMDYIKEGFTLPVPLNLIPTPIGIYEAIKWILAKIKQKKKGLEHKSSVSASSTPVDDPASNFDHRSQVSHNHFSTNHGSIKNYSETSKKGDQFRHQVIEENQKLTHKIVIERVVKRFLMHNQGDSEDPKLNEIDEMKQEVQVIKSEILTDIKKFREENVKRVFMLNNNLQYVTEEFLHKYKLKFTDNKPVKQTDTSTTQFQTDNTEWSSNEPPVTEKKGHKALQKFRNLCSQNKNMLKAISAFNMFQGMNQRIQTEQMMLKEKKEMINESETGKQKNNMLGMMSKSASDSKSFEEDSGNETASSSLTNLNNLPPVTLTIDLNIAETAPSVKEADEKKKNTPNTTNKIRVFEDFQSRLDFDLHAPYDD